MGTLEITSTQMERGLREDILANMIANANCLVSLRNGKTTTLKKAYEKNLHVMCSNYSAYVKARDAYISRCGQVFASKHEFNCWCDD